MAAITGAQKQPQVWHVPIKMFSVGDTTLVLQEKGQHQKMGDPLEAMNSAFDLHKKMIEMYS